MEAVLPAFPEDKMYMYISGIPMPFTYLNGVYKLTNKVFHFAPTWRHVNTGNWLLRDGFGYWEVTSDATKNADTGGCWIESASDNFESYPDPVPLWSWVPDGMNWTPDNAIKVSGRASSTEPDPRAAFPEDKKYMYISGISGLLKYLNRDYKLTNKVFDFAPTWRHVNTRIGC